MDARDEHDDAGHCPSARWGGSVTPTYAYTQAEQNVEIALGAVGRAYVLQQGRIVLQGRSDQLANDPQVREAYLGV